jgi:hypothetical protein
VESCRAHSCTELDLENCSVTNISAADFYALSSVTYLNLMDNSITVLKTKFSGSQKVNKPKLRMEPDNMTAIENGSFKGLKNLHRLF